MFEEVYILFHCNIILKHNGMTSIKIQFSVFQAFCIFTLFILHNL